MNTLNRFIAGLGALTMLTAMPVAASADTTGGVSTSGEALKLRRLEMMLMVTSLRCRTTADDFQADYLAFQANHAPALAAAARELRAGYVGEYGQAGADRALDRLSVGMANEYGGGHPYMDCHELKQAARDLADAPGREPLLAAADQLLASEAPRLAFNQR